MPTVFLCAQEIPNRTENYVLPERGICAHRGANETHPENTIAAFKEAVRLGAQMIEFDVRMTKDHKLVVIHDASVDRTTNGTGSVQDLTWATIKTLDAGVWKAKKFKGERIPLFLEALTGFPKNVWLNIHLKGNEELGESVAAIIKAAHRENQVIIACNKESAVGVRKIDAKIRICNMERTENRETYINETIKGNFSTLQFLKNRDDNSLANDITTLKKNGIRINYHYSTSAEDGIKLLI